MSRKIVWVVLPLLLLGCGGKSTQQPTAAYQIQMAIYTPLCLEVQDGSQAQGQIIQTYPCISGENRQEWILAPSTNNTGVNIVNINSKQCMSVANAVAQPSTPIVQAPCYSPSMPSQVWTVPQSVSPIAGFSFRSALSTATNALCLDIPEGETVGETPMQVYTCNTQPDPAQSFAFNGVPLGNRP